MSRLNSLIRSMLGRMQKPSMSEAGSAVLPELYELRDDVRAGLRSIELRGPIYVVTRILCAHGLEDQVVDAVRRGDREWFAVLVELLQAGARVGLWDIGTLGASEFGRMVERALQAEGGAVVLAVELARQVDRHGEAAYVDASELLGRWRGAARRGATAAAKAEVTAPVVSEEKEATTAPAGEGEAVDARILTKQELVALNVNQHTGDRFTHGWYEQGKYLLLQRSKVPAQVLRKMEDLGLLLDTYEGKAAGPGRLFSAKAGDRRFRNVLAVDLAGIQAVVGSAWKGVEDAWLGPNMSHYAVTEVTGMGREEPGEKRVETAVVTTEQCPRCSGYLTKKQGEGVFFVCATPKCGWSVDAGSDGRPAIAERCDRCGGEKYPTRRNGKVVLEHLHPCKQGAEAVAAAA